MEDDVLTRAEEGWRWNHPAIDPGGPFDAPLEAVEAGIEALRAAVDAGKLSPQAARDVAMDARFALGANEHHLGGPDADAFERLSAFEDELAEG